MADILLDRLPSAWAGRPIDWDFRPMVWFNGQYLRLPEDEKGLPELARETMRRFYRVAVPPEEEVDAFKALVEFYTAGPQEVADRPGSSRTEELALDYVTDGSAIVAAFQQAYGIDLTRARLHWWRFKALMSNLPEETQLVKIIGFRTADPAQFQGAERERRAELKERFALPAALRKGGGRIVTLQDRNEAFAARFRRWPRPGALPPVRSASAGLGHPGSQRPGHLGQMQEPGLPQRNRNKTLSLCHCACALFRKERWTHWPQIFPSPAK